MLFVLGLLALRSGLIDEPRRHVRLIATWMAFGFASWALYWAVLFQLPEGQFAPIDWQVRYGFGIVTEQWLCFTFIGGMILLFAFRPQWRSRLDWVGTAGRMALTNYMLQAAALDFIVSGYGSRSAPSGRRRIAAGACSPARCCSLGGGSHGTGSGRANGSGAVSPTGAFNRCAVAPSQNPLERSHPASSG